MSGENALDPRNLTFSQAHGYEELPQPLKLEELSREARTRLWSSLFRFVSLRSKYYLSKDWETVFVSLHVKFFALPLDEFENTTHEFVKAYKPVFMDGPFNRVFDLLLAIVRHPQCPPLFSASVSLTFRECHLAYVLDVGPPPAIFPAATQEEGAAVLHSIANLSSAGLAGAVSHLRHASDCINQGDFPGAVRESINAVESTARKIAPDAKTLEPALWSLEKAKALHPALKQAFSKLYGYTSDEQGIRHALIDNPQANVGQDEAIFMFGACASFSSYLARKHQRRAP